MKLVTTDDAIFVCRERDMLKDRVAFEKRINIELLGAIDDLQSKLSAANALLARVFGLSAVTCHIACVDSYDKSRCSLCSMRPCATDERRPDCPYLPFEVKK